MSWLGFAGAFGLFFATHSIPVRPQIKSRIVARCGAAGFGIGYSILSIAVLSFLVHAANNAPVVQLWAQMPWHRHAVLLGMLVVCLILGFAIARPNPLSFGGANNDDFDPAWPGIIRITRHPVLLALTLWAGLHLLPNGDLAHVLLFGILGSFAFGGQVLVDRRKRRELGQLQWQGLCTEIRAKPIFNAPQSWTFACLRSVIALAAFGVLLLLHPIVIGVPAL